MRVEQSDGEKNVTRGPFAEPSKLIAGFWVWQTESLRDAIEWVKRCPLVDESDTQIEIRQLLDLRFGDFGDFGTDIEPEGADYTEPLVAA